MNTLHEHVSQSGLHRLGFDTDAKGLYIHLNDQMHVISSVLEFNRLMTSPEAVSYISLQSGHGPIQQDSVLDDLQERISEDVKWVLMSKDPWTVLYKQDEESIACIDDHELIAWTQLKHYKYLDGFKVCNRLKELWFQGESNSDMLYCIRVLSLQPEPLSRFEIEPILNLDRGNDSKLK